MQINKKKFKKVIYINILLFIILIGYYFLNKYYGVKILCPFNKLTGLLCPGCGITRCLFSIINLDFKKAFYYNQLVFVFLPFFIFIYLYNTYDYVFERKKPIKVPDKVGILLVVLTIAFGIIRNII